MRVLVTGAQGFVGSALARHFASQPGWQLRTVTRRPLAAPLPAQEEVVIDDLATASLGDATQACDVVVHAAARAHILRDEGSAALDLFRHHNTLATLRLARQAADDGVRQFIYLSSVKVHGESTARGRPFQPDDPLRPQDAYGTSKAEAEEGLRRLASESAMQVTIVRPPLVYGPGVKANFQSLLRAVARGVPLPLGGIDNRRSLIALDNLVDFVSLCALHPAAAGHAFLVSDGQDLSTPELVRRMAMQMHRPARLLPVPPAWLHALATLTGRQGTMQRLCSDLQVDIGKNLERLAWQPPISVDEGLRRTVEAMEGL